ncbi:MAG: hypothetical protein MZU84_03260 [Sphingobacterium sp.]|nr:hypothetical protein [Sphingobacterium sp.]
MASITYPKWLPLPTIDGYKFSHVSPFIRTEMVTGRARQRRAYTSVPSFLSFSWNMKRTEAGLFEVWFKETLGDGVEWFEFVMESPAGLKEYTCRFSAMYEGPELVGIDRFKISAVVEVKERPLIDKIWLDFPDFYLGGSVIDLALNREWPE